MYINVTALSLKKIISVIQNLTVSSSISGWSLDRDLFLATCIIYSLLTRSKEQRHSPDTGFHELCVDAHHVRSRQAVLVVAVADGVNPGQVGHVAEQNHPLEKRLLGLMTTWRKRRTWTSEFYMQNFSVLLLGLKPSSYLDWWRPMWRCLPPCSWYIQYPDWPPDRPFLLPECLQPGPPQNDVESCCQTCSWTQPGLQGCSTAPRTEREWIVGGCVGVKNMFLQHLTLR